MSTIEQIIADMRDSADAAAHHGEYVADTYLRDYANRIEHAMTHPGHSMSTG